MIESYEKSRNWKNYFWKIGQWINHQPTVNTRSAMVTVLRSVEKKKRTVLNGLFAGVSPCGEQVPAAASFATLLRAMSKYSSAAREISKNTYGVKLSECMNKLSSVLSPGGRWLFTDFQICAPPKRYWQAPLIDLMYRFFRLACKIRANRLPNFERDFKSCGLVETKSASFFGGVIISRVYRFGD